MCYNLAHELKEYGPWGNIWTRVAEWAKGISDIWTDFGKPTASMEMPEYEALSKEPHLMFIGEIIDVIDKR